MKKFLVSLTRHPLGLLGSVIVTVSAVLIVTLFLMDVFGLEGSPYVGILTYMILPGVFVLGLILIPIGVLRERKRARLAEEAGEKPAGFPVIDLNVDSTRQRVMLFLLLTVVNLVILATATYKGVEHMETTEFCGETCHSVMTPEFTAYNRSPHARVACVSCHIGPGADWFVKSKLSGSWQVVSVMLDLYPRPIPTPVHNLRPARETCEQCHWPTQFAGDRLAVRTHYAEDEANTELKTVLLLRVGGIQGRVAQGIHWHVDPANEIRYRANEDRSEIYDVELSQPDGTKKLFRASEETPEDAGEWRVMDCIDCHNRPSHIYRLPAPEVDTAILERRIDRGLPYVRREAVRLLEQEYASHDEARAGIREGLVAFYRESYPELAASDGVKIDAAAEAIGDIYGWNVFPSMNIEWGTYPNHIGHETDAGCFRCHDDLHETAEGETISQDCETCHSLLAMEEEDPAILSELNP
jgi:nitrate/TMAO reductase-like tetraheme cytochrome c subunit